MKITFTDCRPADVERLESFFTAMYPPGYALTMNERLFEWQFLDTPAAGQEKDAARYHFKLALRGDAIIGCLGYVPVVFALGGRRLRGAWTANWMVDPEFRRMGIGPLLLRELMRSVEVTAAVGLAADARSILPRMGWTDFGSLTRYVAVLDRAAAASLTAGGELEGATAADGSRRVRHNVEAVAEFDDSADVLWQELACGRAATERSSQFLNWRYAQHPVFRYRLLTARADRRLSGLAVYRIEQVRDRDTRVARIVELLGDADAIEALADTVLAEMLAEGIAFADFFCAGHGLTPVLDRVGLVTGPGTPADQLPMLLQPLDHRRATIPFMAYLGQSDAAATIHDWYVTKGDGDQDRPN